MQRRSPTRHPRAMCRACWTVVFQHRTVQQTRHIARGCLVGERRCITFYGAEVVSDCVDLQRIVVLKSEVRSVVQRYLRNHGYTRAIRYSYNPRAGKTGLHGPRPPAETHPLVRRLVVPRLCYRDEVCIAVVVEVDYTAERVGDVGDSSESIAGDREVIPVAILDLPAAEFILDLEKTELRAIRCAE